MASPKSGASRERGRPPRVTDTLLRRAILEIRGREPTIEDLAAHLGVTKAALYNHVKGQEALRALATDTILGAWRLEAPAPDAHWARWALDYARALRSKLDEYPVLLHGLQAQPGNQLIHVETVIDHLVHLGLDTPTAFFAYYALMSLTVGTGISSAVARFAPETVMERFAEAIEATPHPLPHLRSIREMPSPELTEPVFDELVWFTLQGIAARRGETLPPR